MINYLKECFKVYLKWLVAQAIVSVILTIVIVVSWASIIAIIAKLIY